MVGKYTPPRSTCAICGGPIHDRGIFQPQGVWLHDRESDWIDNPHNAMSVEDWEEKYRCKECGSAASDAHAPNCPAEDWLRE